MRGGYKSPPLIFIAQKRTSCVIERNAKLRIRKKSGAVKKVKTHRAHFFLESAVVEFLF